MRETEATLLRIGAFSRTVGVPVSVLRAWEARYGLFAPSRTPGGFRLYSAEDEARVRRMRAHLDAGLAARESARLALMASDSRARTDAVSLFLRARDAFDAGQAHAALDVALDGSEAPAFLSGAVLPALSSAAEQGDQGALGYARVHFSSRMLETRLVGMSSRWYEGDGPLAIVGCGPGEHHTLGALGFAFALRERGWRIGYLGADMPLAAFEAAARSMGPERVVVAFTLATAFEAVRDGLGELAAQVPLALAGPGVPDDVAALRLEGDPATVARGL